MQYCFDKMIHNFIPFKVLVAGSKPDYRQFLSAVLLASPRFDVIGEASDAHQACEMAKENNADLLILDMDINRDFDRLRTFTDACPDLKVILTSYYDFSQYSELANRSHSTAFIPKTRLSTQSILNVLKEKNQEK